MKMSNKEISTINSYTALEGFNLADALSEEMVGMNITFDRVMIPPLAVQCSRCQVRCPARRIR